MTGYATIKKIRAFEERAAKIGFAVIEPDHTKLKHTGTYGSVWIDELSTETVSLTPVDNRYPCWRRGSAVFTGSIEEAKFFFQGVEFAQVSDSSIGLTSDKKRATAEVKYIERMARLEAARKKKAEQKKVWDILKYGKAKDYDEVPF